MSKIKGPCIKFKLVSECPCVVMIIYLLMSDIAKCLITFKYSYYVQSLENCMVQLMLLVLLNNSSNDFP